MKHSESEQLFNEIDQTLQELVNFSQNNLLKCGRRIIPHLTSDDILQPNDFPELENHPIFRYEEGILAGIQSALMAVRAYQQRIKLHDE
ncbi:MAG: hypothetical protein Q8K60_09115 [Parachlamydiaceae bacterium]|nr:hypothetical protein [Parachlamydiaceae bacterium]